VIESLNSEPFYSFTNVCSTARCQASLYPSASTVPPGKTDAHKIPEAIFDFSAQRPAQLIALDVIDFAEVKNYGQIVDDAVEGVLWHILDLDGGH
jgi:hypothetical protein